MPSGLASSEKKRQREHSFAPEWLKMKQPFEMDPEIEAMLEVLTPACPDTSQDSYFAAVGPDELLAFYRPSVGNGFDEEQTLFINTSWRKQGRHLTGVSIFKASHPDYAFWCWIVNVRRPDGVLGEDQVEELKREFAAETY